MLLQHISDLHFKISEREEKLIRVDEILQPSMVIIGESLDTINTVCCIDQQLYQFDSIIRGFDVVFKIIHVLNAKYLKEAEQCWIIVQKNIYNLSTEWDKELITTSTAELIRDIEVHM